MKQRPLRKGRIEGVTNENSKMGCVKEERERDDEFLRERRDDRKRRSKRGKSNGNWRMGAEYWVQAFSMGP
jgi:hypothetical protein